MGIFKKTSTETENIPSTGSKGGVPTMKYFKPKVLLLDLPNSATDALIAKGYNASVGSLGKPYKVPKKSTYLPLIGSGNLPNYTEQEIVVVDLHYGELAKEPDEEKHRPEEEVDIWAKCDRGFIDPRPRNAIIVHETFNRIHSTGGVFIVFADEKNNIEMQFGRIRYRELEIDEPLKHDTWDFISELSDMVVKTDHGFEMHKGKDDSSLSRLVSEHLEGGEFFCTLQGGYRRSNPWVTIAENKYGQAVALCRCLGQHGSVIVLPQLADKAGFLLKLFSDVLPEIAPHLFPNIERGMWTHQPEYELERVLELRAKQIEVEQRAKDEIAGLEAELAKEREINGWIHELLTGTGDLLVEAVKEALAQVGFQKVVDVDKERDKEGKSRREDLQIQDQSPWLIVDVKGIGNHPSDDDVLQADKHATIRMRELGRTDIVGFSIINHQRHIPPLDRDNEMPFRQEMIDVALQSSLGLMTTWDLYRLVVNSKKLGWDSNDVRPLFYQSGRVKIVPRHYRCIGKVVKAWTDKFGIDLECEELQVGDRIAVEFPISFEESLVESIFVNNKNVEQANIGDPVGLAWSADKQKLREGMKVYRIPQ